MMTLIAMYIAGAVNIIIVLGSVAALRHVQTRLDRIPKWWADSFRITWVWQMSVVSVFITLAIYRFFTT